MDPKFTANTLYRKNNRHYLVKVYADEILNAIKQDINNAVNNGLTHCDFSPPEFFSIQDMPNREAQLLIYTRVLSELDTRGFQTKIDRKNTKWRISGWDLDVNRDVHNKMLEYYMSKCVEDLDK
jgi:hypothetical protein